MTRPLPDLSAAEDFFNSLGVAFEQHVLDVHRLHILHRFRHYLAAKRVLEAEQQEAAWRDCLGRAYADYAGAEPPPKTFKVFQQPGFVPLSSLFATAKNDG